MSNPALDNDAGGWKGGGVGPNAISSGHVTSAGIHWLDSARFHGNRRDPVAIDMVLWHQTDNRMAVKQLSDYLNSGLDGKKSYHYVIEKSGAIWRLLPWEITAYHAGRSAWPVGPLGVLPGQSVNSRSIGIAFVGRVGDELTRDQHDAGVKLFLGLTKIPLELPYQLGHKEVAPKRKHDPSFSMTLWRQTLKAALL